MEKGDIVLIPFPFTDLTGNKNRPAVVLIDGQADVTVCFMTTHLGYQTEYDIKLLPSDKNGLKKTTLIRLHKIATIDKDLVLGKLGNLSISNIKELNRNLIKLFKLNSRE